MNFNQLLEKKKTFVIPAYQRGYVWGKNREGEKNSVEYLIKDLLKKFENNEKEIFLQGLTVSEKDHEIILIDGQQRTIFLYLLLKWLGYKGQFNIKYDIREKSDDFLKEVNNDFDNNDFTEKKDEYYQDIYFFKKTMRIIEKEWKEKNIDKQEFLTYVINKIQFLYIEIPEEQATKVFTMMNGNKAQMQQEEIIKAEVLRLVSLNTSENDIEQEWENNLLRSRYAREWDQWLRWWNNKKVQSLYCCNNNTGWLISSYLEKEKKDKIDILTFEDFKNNCLGEVSVQKAKQTFDGLRRLQKRFEDSYNNYNTHNMIGAILRLSSNEDKRKFIRYYFAEDNRDEKELENYYKLIFLSMTHEEIINKNKEKFSEKFDNTYKQIDNDLLYEDNDCKETAYRLLLRLNIEQDNKQKRFFNFDIWENRSLEHIYPKSKVLHRDEKGNLLNVNNEIVTNKTKSSIYRDEIKTNEGYETTEHSIGNLVLLYKNENSAFNNNDFLHKKELFFNPNKTELVKSRLLLHTVCVFAEKQDWNGNSIAENKKKTIEQFDEYYKELKSKFEYEKQN